MEGVCTTVEQALTGALKCRLFLRLGNAATQLRASRASVACGRPIVSRAVSLRTNASPLVVEASQEKNMIQKYVSLFETWMVCRQPWKCGLHSA